MKTQLYPGLTPQRLQEILTGMDAVRVGLLGDLCLDMYMEADMRLAELSREVPNFNLPIVRERTSPGGAGNVAANLAALGPKRLEVLGVVGQDWRGGLLLDALREKGVSADAVLQSKNVTTNAYIKPLRSGYADTVYEGSRMDYENRSPLPQEEEQQLLEQLNQIAGKLDVLCVSDQLRFGCITPAVRQQICRLGREGLCVVVDSRERIGLYEHVLVKPNEVEAMRALDKTGVPDAEMLAGIAQKLSEKNQRPALVTFGAQGCLVTDGAKTAHVPGREVLPPVDICGAGDTFLSAFACAYAGCGNLFDAAALANLASSVTVKKIGVTGTATRDEIIHANGK